MSGERAVAAASGRFDLWQRVYSRGIGYVFLLPTLAFLVVFSYYPAFSALWHAFYNWDGAFVRGFVGLKNFVDIVRDPIIHLGIRNVVILWIAGLIKVLTFPLLTAELIFSLRSQRAAYWYRTLFIVPMVIPGIVIILLWQYIYDPQLGLLNRLLAAAGWRDVMPPGGWLGNMEGALAAIIGIGFPWAGGLSMLIYLAGLQSISGEVIEAAQLDGAIGLRRVVHIDIPLIMGQIKLMIILTTIGVLESFEVLLILTEGGPNNATMTPALWMFMKGFRFQQFGYASAVGVMIFLVVLGLTYVNTRYIRSSIEYEA
ncbi:MAG: carbohydrate ABC transporter permease [Anaerolineae bacterium]